MKVVAGHKVVSNRTHAVKFVGYGEPEAGGGLHGVSAWSAFDTLRVVAITLISGIAGMAITKAAIELVKALVS